MSTATLPVAGPIGVHHRAFWRFAWKEYRMLRGFWLAVAVLAVVIQLIALGTLPRAVETAEMLFSVALGATVLYAVGAAATLFAVEHEEETYDLLTTLPVVWKPVFLAKLFVATVSSMALLAVLVGSSFTLGGPWDRDVANLLLPAIAEAIAWGIFMSLTIRRPLVAAVATIAVVSAQANLSIGMMSDVAVAIQDPNNYSPAMPWRLAIAAVVLLMDVALGREWLRTRTSKRPAPQESATMSAALTAEVKAAYKARVSTLGMMSRLLWQTWRESWLAILLTILFASTIGLFGVVILLRTLLNSGPRYTSLGPTEVAFVVLCVLSALYGSQVFSADQRGSRYRFLAEHAGRPRLLWLCRQMSWFGGLCTLIGLTFLVIGPAALISYKREIAILDSTVATYKMWWDSPHYVVRFLRESEEMINALFAAVMGAICGYSIGQFASLMLRRSISAGFLATLLAMMFAIWGVIVYLWRLPPSWFLLPIALGLLAATWVRASEWLIDRHSIWNWTKVFLAIACPIIVVFASLPSARFRQIGNPMYGSFARLAVDDGSGLSTSEIPLSAEAEELIHLAESIERVPGSADDASSRELADQRYLEWKRRLTEKNEEIIVRTVELSKLDSISFPVYDDGSTTYTQLRYLANLLEWAGEVRLEDGKLDKSLELYLSALRLLGDIRRYQKSSAVASVLKDESEVMQRIAKWADHPKQSSKRLLDAIDELNRIYPNTHREWALISMLDTYQPAFPLDIADYQILREVILGERSTSILATEYTNVSDHLAVLANRLPFERKRALWVLAAIAEQERMIADDVWSRLLQSQNQPHGSRGNAYNIRRAIAREVRHRRFDEKPLSHADTSYLLSKERRARFDFESYLQAIADHFTQQLGLKQQLALVAYRLDHGTYPKKIIELTPDYLPAVPIDPYAGEPFKYDPVGLPLLLSFRGGSLPPDTPFIWSVGSGNCRLVLDSAEKREVEDNTRPYDMERREFEEFYRLLPDTSNWWIDDALVFPLPWIDAPSAKENE